MGMGSIHVSTPERRDRLWLLNAFAIALLTLLGAAGEALGYDRHLKSNTTKRRTHSLFRQGCMLYELIPTMPEVRLLPLIERFARCSPNSRSLPILSGHPTAQRRGNASNNSTPTPALSIWRFHQPGSIRKQRLGRSPFFRDHLRHRFAGGAFKDAKIELGLKPADTLCPLKVGDELFTDTPDACP